MRQFQSIFYYKFEKYQSSWACKSQKKRRKKPFKILPIVSLPPLIFSHVHFNLVNDADFESVLKQLDTISKVRYDLQISKWDLMQLMKSLSSIQIKK